MTQRKQEILQCIGRFHAREGFSPTVRDICQSMGRSSPGSMQKDLELLENAEFLERSPGKSRTWQLTHKAWDLIGMPSSPSIPLVGQIAAGTPILADHHKEEDLPVDPRLFGSDEAFAIRVRGDSMRDAQIRDGDLAIIRPQHDADDGQIVAVLIDNVEPEATLKVLRRHNGTVELHPANPDYSVQSFEGEDRARVHILGKLIGVIRMGP